MSARTTPGTQFAKLAGMRPLRITIIGLAVAAGTLFACERHDDHGNAKATELAEAEPMAGDAGVPRGPGSGSGVGSGTSPGTGSGQPVPHPTQQPNNPKSPGAPTVPAPAPGTPSPTGPTPPAPH